MFGSYHTLKPRGLRHGHRAANRPERRDLLQRARKSGDPATALRFLIGARLGLRKTSSEVASDLEVARSTVVRTAHRDAEEGVAELYD